RAGRRCASAARARRGTTRTRSCRRAPARRWNGNTRSRARAPWSAAAAAPCTPRRAAEASASEVHRRADLHLERGARRERREVRVAEVHALGLGVEAELRALRLA